MLPCARMPTCYRLDPWGRGYLQPSSTRERIGEGFPHAVGFIITAFSSHFLDGSKSPASQPGHGWETPRPLAHGELLRQRTRAQLGGSLRRSRGKGPRRLTQAGAALPGYRQVWHARGEGDMLRCPPGFRPAAQLREKGVGSQDRPCLEQFSAVAPGHLARCGGDWGILAGPGIFSWGSPETDGPWAASCERGAPEEGCGRPGQRAGAGASSNGLAFLHRFFLLLLQLCGAC